MNIQERVKRECHKKAITQAELAMRLGKKPPNLHNQLSNDQTVQFGLLKSICQILEIPVESLFSDEPSHGDNMDICQQLKLIIENGDKEVATKLIGDIGYAYMQMALREKPMGMEGNGA
jgi:transcriptional regulator with XRE-family HTH domain